MKINARNIRQSGSVFFALFGAVVMLGVLGVAVNTIMKGPLTSVTEVTRRTMAENAITAHSRLAVTLAAAGAGVNGDCDSDGYVEPLPYRDAGVAAHPVGGGYLPAAMGNTTADPWNMQYGYCVWDTGSLSVADNIALCGGSAAKRLKGAPGTQTQTAVAVISAGKDRIFQTACNAYVDTSPADGTPDVPLLNKPALSDDIVQGYSYAEASSMGAGGLWALKDATTAAIAKDLDVTGKAELTGPLKLSSGGLRLPDDPGNNSLTGACSAANSNQLRRNTSSSPSTLEICDDTGSGLWEIALGGSGNGVVPTHNNPCTMSDIGSVRLNAKNLQICTGVEWKNILEGAIDSNAAVWTARDQALEYPALDQEWGEIAYGNGTYVAVAYSGANRIMASTDGVLWKAIAAPQANGWVSVTYGNGLFVAVAVGGTNRVMTSPDGITWTLRTAAAANVWTNVRYGNGLFIAVSSSGTDRVMTSPDGITWTARTAAENNSWNGVVFANGLYVAVARDGTNRVMTSPDAIIWTTRSVPGSVDWLSITYGGGVYVAVGMSGGVMSSPDGITWTLRTAVENNGWYEVTYGNGKFVAVANNGTVSIMTSPDGITWTGRTSPTASRWQGLIYGNGLFVTVADVGTLRIATSPDGITWTARQGPGILSTSIYQDVIYAKNKFIAVANTATSTAQQIMSSTDGKTWVYESTVPVASGWTVIGYGNGLFVILSTSGKILTSPDAITWTARTEPEANLWTDIIYANGLFVAVGQSAATYRVMTSPDGITWTGRTLDTVSAWRSVAYGKGLFVAVANNGTNRIATSPDGITWTIRTAPSTNAWNGVSYGNGLFVSVASSGAKRAMTSSDGITWTDWTVQANNWQKLTYGNGLYVATCTVGTNRVMTSRDGINWALQMAAAANSWGNIAYGNGMFVSVATDGTQRIMTSED